MTQDHEGRQFAFADSNGMVASTTRNTAGTEFDAQYKYDVLGRPIGKAAGVVVRQADERTTKLRR